MPVSSSARDIKHSYYSQVTPGQQDYWRKMAAPRLRVSTLLRLLGEERPQRVVDLGCGNAWLLEKIRLCHPAAELAGIDLADALIDVNRRRLPGINFYAMDLCAPKLELPARLGARFDAVMAAEIIEHVDDPLRFLCNARSLAAPHGRLLLSTQSGPLRETERRVGHRRHFRDHELAELLRAAGFEPLRIWNCGFPFHDLSKWYANRDPDGSLRSFGEDRYGLRQELVCLALRLAFRLNSNRRGAQLFAMARALPDRSAIP